MNAQPAPYRSPRVSPDGRKLAVETTGDDGVGVVWVYDLAGDKAIQQLTFEGDNRRPIWTPDSRYVTFASDRGGTMSLYWKPANGSGVAERLTTADEGTVHRAGSWSPDGRTLSFMVVRGGDDWDIWTLVREGENAPESLYDAPGRMYHGPEFSPDGKWLAYGVGDRGSNQDIYVEPFPPTGARWRISQEGGNFPLWSPDASALFYRRTVVQNSSRRLQSVDVKTAPDFTFGNERTLPIERFLIFPFYRDYDITPDGQRFVMVFPEGQAEPGESSRGRIEVVLNWFNELERLVPTK